MWAPFNFFLGAWQGSGQGRPGTSRVERKYEFALNNQFLFVQSKSVYEPQEKNPEGETHEEWGLISYDNLRKTFVLRQFHVEVFELAAPDKDFEIYSETRLQRVRLE